MRWHPDRCSASGNSKYVDEAKKKFQAIQEAYSVLSDANKRFLYDVGVYDSDDDENGMADFLDEMADMMNQNKSHENGEESFEELKVLFEEMFQSDIDAFGSSSQTVTPSSSCSSSFTTSSESSNTSNKRNSSKMNLGNSKLQDSYGFDAEFQGFCVGAGHLENSRRGRGAGGHFQGKGGSRRSGSKQKISAGHDVSSRDNSSISALWCHSFID